MYSVEILHLAPSSDISKYDNLKMETVGKNNHLESVKVGLPSDVKTG